MTELSPTAGLSTAAAHAALRQNDCRRRRTPAAARATMASPARHAHTTSAAWLMASQCLVTDEGSTTTSRVGETVILLHSPLRHY